MTEVSKYWWLILLKGIILIVLSIFIIQYPAGTLLGITIYMGIALLFTGIFLIAIAVSTRQVDDQWGWKLAMGLIDIIFAIVLLSSPAISAAALPFAVGFWMIFYGVMLFAGSFAVKKAGDSGWWLNLVGGILTIIVGYIIMNNLVTGAIAITIWIGSGFFLFGVINISEAFSLKKLNK